MKGSTYIRVAETRRSIAEKRRAKEIKATLYVNGALVCEVMPICSAEDDNPEGTAIALLWLAFEQRVGQDIRRDRPQ
jgi:transcriptional regulator of aromatic amino acid metabolism